MVAGFSLTLHFKYTTEWNARPPVVVFYRPDRAPFRGREKEVDPIRHRTAELALLLVFSAALLIHIDSFRYTVDDAFISFRYAENLAGGNGLVFNRGEPVEGYTNFLWTVLIAGGIRAGIDPVPFSRVAGTAAGLLLLWTAFYFARSRLPGGSLAFLLPVPIVANGAFALWCGAGLETVLFTFLLFLGAALAVGWRGEGEGAFTAAALVFSLAALTRPEGTLFFVVLLFDRVVIRRAPWRGTLAGAALFAAVVGAHEAWRIAFYGDPLPNTFYAKSGGGFAAAARGFVYIGRFFGRFGGWTLLAPLGLLVLGPLRRWERTFLLLLAAQIGTVVLAGGDSLPFFRFLVPAIPFLAVLAIAGMDRLFSYREGDLSRFRVLLFSVILAIPLHGTFRGETIRFLEEDRDRIELHWKVIGRWLAETASPGESIAVTTAGAIPYYSRLETIDMLGITDRHIARREMPEMGSGLAGHEKHDMAYVLSRKPTYILHYPFLLPEPVFSVSQFRTPWNRGLEELLDNDRFDREYQGESASIGPMHLHQHLVYFKRKEDIP